MVKVSHSVNDKSTGNGFTHKSGDSREEQEIKQLQEQQSQEATNPSIFENPVPAQTPAPTPAQTPIPHQGINDLMRKIQGNYQLTPEKLNELMKNKQDPNAYITKAADGTFDLQKGYEIAGNELKAYDKNKDGSTSICEFGEEGKRMDLNGDKNISAGERLAYNVYQDTSLNSVPNGAVSQQEKDAVNKFYKDCEAQGQAGTNLFRDGIQGIYNQKGSKGTSIADLDKNAVNKVKNVDAGTTPSGSKTSVDQAKGTAANTASTTNTTKQNLKRTSKKTPSCPQKETTKAACPKKETPKTPCNKK